MNRQFTINVFRKLALVYALLAVAGAAYAEEGHADHGPLTVYTETNAAAGNEIAIIQSDPDGDLRLVGKVSTGGLGNDSPLQLNQGALALSRDGRRLYAVNEGSNDISAFAVRDGELKLIDKVSSGGTQPLSLALHDDILYVVNTDNITGFSVGHDRRLRPIPGSTKPLSGAVTFPAQIGFDLTGELLVVTEKATNKIDLYSVDDHGVAMGPFVKNSYGLTPFGFAFDRYNRLIVSEAVLNSPNASSMSSYDDVDGVRLPLEVISGSVLTHQTSACWVVITKDNRYTYTTNSQSDSISGYRISGSGKLTLLDGSGVTALTGQGSIPTDMALSPDSRLLFVVLPGTGAVKSYRIRSDGSLAYVSTVQGLTRSATGLETH
jgi:6-phosphogluconolactonase